MLNIKFYLKYFIYPILCSNMIVIYSIIMSQIWLYITTKNFSFSLTVLSWGKKDTDKLR
jgi:hypothetical protein